MVDQQLILVKHSQPKIVPEVPAMHWRLSEEGRSRCLRLADEIQPFAPLVVACSNEVKAFETAEILTRTLDLAPPIQSVGLREHQRDNEPFSEKSIFEAKVKKFFSEPTQLVFGHETADEAYQRFEKATHSLVAQYVHSTIVMVTHGTVISLLVSRHNRVEPFRFWQELGLPSLVVLSLTDYKIRSVITKVV
ncbi:MAG: histidine phosphatase family protein [Anaerolineae bacterium]